MITQKELKELLQYDENTGIFTWLKKTKKIQVGSVAGYITPRGYIYITINNKRYLAHRLAWLYIYGTWPINQIDHINGNRVDNRIENLRDISSRQNNSNRQLHRNGKLVGVSYDKNNKKWKASIGVNKKSIHIGYYNTELEAHEAYLKFLNNLTINN